MMIKLIPAFKNYLWGGTRLIRDFGKRYDGDALAESWELSCHPDGMSTVGSGQMRGKSFEEYIYHRGREVLGRNCSHLENFPILIKLIDAKSDLSVQVHPDDDYALKNENSFGKTEMWYVVDCEPGAKLYYGFKNKISKEDFVKFIDDGTIMDHLRSVEVKPGDVFFIAAGTIHAIGAGILIAEIQQNSNLTYRVFDYNRRGVDGNLRELHVDKALKITSLEPPQYDYNFCGHIAMCKYFTVDKITSEKGPVVNTVTCESFHHLLFLNGTAKITCGEDSLCVSKGESVFIDADSGAYKISGEFTLLLTTIP